jgi:site-specific recombinase XerD
MLTIEKPTITIYHDTRHKKKNGLYPVKLRVYHNYETRFYKTKIDLSETDFTKSYLAEKPRGDYKTLHDKINAQLVRAIEVADGLPTFSFDKFERRVKRPTGAGNNVLHHYKVIIDALRADSHIGTAINYEYSQKSLVDYLKAKAKKSDYLSFDDVTPDFLKGYEHWMLEQGYSRTTIGIYLRPLRAVFNVAIEEENLPKDNYPFGKAKTKYKIPSGRKVKKSLSKPELNLLANHPLPKGSHQLKARDLWLFTYLANGMNIRDLCNLRQKDYNGATIVFYRHKIADTAKDDLKPIIVPVTDRSKAIIEKYGNRKQDPDSYLFPFFTDAKTEEERVRISKNLCRYCNQHVKLLAKEIGINPGISLNWARHSFTSISVRNGQSLEFVQSSLGHQNISTTMSYWDDFEVNQKIDNANNLL